MTQKNPFGSPQALEDFLLSFVHKEYFGQPWRGKGIAPARFRSFVKASKDLGISFTSDRSRIRKGYLSRKEFRSAYLMSFHQANVERSKMVLEELSQRELLPQGRLAALEIGAAFAPGLWATRALDEKGVLSVAHYEAWDLHKGLLGDARKLWALAGDGSSLQTREVDLSRRIPKLSKKKNLVFMLNVLNEMASDPIRATRVIANIFDRVLYENGLFVVLEPALRNTSRHLTEVRDRLMAEGLHAVIPCTHDQSCPMNVEKRDWCNFSRSWKSPRLRRRIYDTMGLDADDIRFSYVVFSKEPAKHLPKQHRAISDWMHTKQGPVLNLCAPQKKKRLFLKKGKDGHSDLDALPGRHSIIEVPSSNSPNLRLSAKEIKSCS